MVSAYIEFVSFGAPSFIGNAMDLRFVEVTISAVVEYHFVCITVLKMSFAFIASPSVKRLLLTVPAYALDEVLQL